MKWIKWLSIAFISCFLTGTLAVIGLYFYIAPELPNVDTLKTMRLQTPMKVYSADGQLLSQFGEKRRIPLEMEQIPETMVNAFLATEDWRFYDHPGIDVIGIARAFTSLLMTGEKRQGASTITMQVARNFFLSREKTYMRKIKEIFLAWHIEELLTKDEILQLYLNKIPLGYRAHGVGAAAEVYYGKSVDELSLAQIAVIAGLPKAPSLLNPIRSPERAKDRRHHVLRRMLEVGAIDQASFAEADAAPITGKYHGPQVGIYAPYLSEMVRQEIINLLGEDEAYTGGYNVYTTVQSKAQIAAEKAVVGNLFAYDIRHGYRGAVKQLWQDGSNALISSDEAQQNDSEIAPISEGWTTEKIFDYLDDVSPVGDLLPAVVISVSETTAEVAVRGGLLSTMPWEGMNWARPYISDERQGKAPKTAAEIVNPGDQIWIRTHEEGELSLAQVPEANAALVALNPKNGGIEALVGGFNYQFSQYNRVTQAKRQVGSNIKPFIYSAALEDNFSLASIINDAPINQWDSRQGTAWRPKNSPPVYEGPTRLRVALAKSKNVISVRLLRAVGLQDLRRYLTRFGFDINELPRNESLALGSASLTPMEVATAFAVFANGGFLVEPYLIDKIEDPQGNIIFQSTPKVACSDCVPIPKQNADDEFPISPATPVEPAQLAPRVISAQNAFLVTQALNSAVWGGGSWRDGTGWNGTAWRAARQLKRRDIAGKTGTTNEAKDAWFSGYNSNLVATSWIGFDDHQRNLGAASRNANMGKEQITGKEFGAKTALPAWITFMQASLKGQKEARMATPEGIVSVRIDRETGKLARRADHTSRFEYFIQGSEPTTFAEATQDNPFDSDDSSDQQRSEELF
ncbi:PBP1A family penicillin-binding protein [Corallincola holothuriorum]|uniref:Penicillin-binding protein 1A n=1 Tax=Corallincola holothuriorum TaxID=2282215 RepID=A0A368N4X9_9GAMM|nr:PBP1A family penicillin-binding protein [Corallincola holothuriorum]RCU45083.1 PBP1A family penicillin-binding protein [Corallincola holothuriorum]